jgi:ATP-dependent DNA helicase RecQ
VSTFGIGQEYTSLQWQSIYRQLVAANLLTIDMSGYGSLRLTEKSTALLRGEQTISLRSEPAVLKKKLKSTDKTQHKQTLIPAVNDILWQALKNKRIALARAQGVPPYVIFHDSTLIEIHHKKPETLAEFATITGVGQHKLERYAEGFMEVIDTYTAQSSNAATSS